jgi:recombination protein RecR
MPASFDRLSRALAALPGIGRRSAERMALGLVLDRGMLAELSGALEMAARSLAHCPRCGALTDRAEALCRVCADPRRDARVVCVVETLEELRLLERMSGFDGQFFCLLGRLAPARGESMSADRLELLSGRVRTEGVAEVVLATGADAAGEATFAYLSERLGTLPCRITRLAAGIPSGSGLSHLDPVTLSRALSARQPAGVRSGI